MWVRFPQHQKLCPALLLRSGESRDWDVGAFPATPEALCPALLHRSGESRDWDVGACPATPEAVSSPPASTCSLSYPLAWCVPHALDVC